MKKLAILWLLVFSLIGCGTEQEKRVLQAEFDESNPSGNSAICLSNGLNPREWINLTEPYTTYDITPGIERYDYLVMANNWLNKRLAIFAQLGLLNQQALANGQYRYTLTELGAKYLYKDNRFCFGRVVIVDMKYQKKQDGKHLYTYRYYLENVPDWANNPLLDEINSVIRDIIARTAETKARGGMVFLTSNKREVAWGDPAGSRRIF
ncbi:hypothetical protein JMI89_10040 [Frischella sp. Ac48]|uniref:hypothetical protein n=1 Tax=Frischella sp. Ac48 TaxID=2804531 RepID=UPI001C7D4EB7|nr:hypothetical protein [Frischella sp. Ac48]MBX4133964.1 hypothetical protein [Frischella sp. Ac48]